MAALAQVLDASLDWSIAQLALAAALGMFLGLEREWSHKSAGVRTFALTSLLGAVFTLVAEGTSYGSLLLAIGGLLVVVQGVLLAVSGLRTEEEGLSLTTSVSLLVAYGVGVLVAIGAVVEGVSVAVISSLLLVLKRELHGFAGGLSRAELRSSTEFAILAFVVFPLLPAGTVELYDIPLEPRVAWLMVVTVAGIGILNYAVVTGYGGRGVAVTGFLGGLASSTAVVGTMLDYARRDPSTVSYGVAAVLLADAAMALRNLTIALAFTLSIPGVSPLTGAIVPLGTIVLGGIGIAALTVEWDSQVDLELESPFSLRNALGFGLVFLLILVAGTVAQTRFGTAGLLVGVALGGFVSSAGATTTAVLLYRSGAVSTESAVIAVLLATATSVVVKTGLAAAGPRQFARRVVLWSVVLLALAAAVTVAAVGLSALP